MILYLDIISTKPKFIFINNNISKSIPILDHNYKKISDIIHKRFIEIEKKYKFFDSLKYFVVNTGPGSYTGLRVGISFILGLSYARNIPIFGLSCTDFLGKSILIKDFYDTVILICSSNNQNFICLPKNHKGRKYQIIQIKNGNTLNRYKLENYKSCVSNVKPPLFLKKNLNVFFNQFMYSNNINNIKKSISNKNNHLLKPIYIKNKIFEI